MKKVKHRLSICAVALMVSAFSMTVLADTLRGDTNNDGTLYKADCTALQEYLLTNRTDIAFAPENYSKQLTANGTDHIFLSIPGGDHDGTTGEPLVYNFIRALFKA